MMGNTKFLALLISAHVGHALIANAMAQEVQWIRSITGTPFFSEIDLRKVARTAGGNTLVGGTFNGDITFESEINSLTLTAPSTNDFLFIANFDASDELEWVRISECTDQIDLAALSADEAGNFYFAVNFTGELSLGNDAMPVNITSTDFGGSSAEDDAVLVKLNAEGDYEWHRQFTNSQVNAISAMHITPANSVLLSMNFRTEVTLPDESGELLVEGADNVLNSVVYAYSSSGELLNWHQLVSNTTVQVNDVTTDALGNSYATGYYFQESFIESTGNSFTLQSPPEGVPYGSFIYQFSAAGEVGWAKEIHGVGQENAFSVVVHPTTGQVYVAGVYDNTLYVNNESGAETLTSLGFRDMFVLSFTTAGEYLWSHSMGGPQDDLLTGIALAEDGIVAAGNTIGSITLDADNPDATFATSSAAAAFAGLSETGSYQWGFVRPFADNLSGICNLDAVVSDANALYATGDALNVNWGTAEDPFIFESPEGPNFGYGFLLRMDLPEVIGVNSVNRQPNFSLYPVPATHRLEVLLHQPGLFVAEVRNIQGQLVLSADLSGNQTALDVSHLAAGVYLCTLRNGNGQQSSRQFMKSNP